MFLNEEHQARFYSAVKNIPNFEPWRTSSMDCSLYIICGDLVLWKILIEIDYESSEMKWLDYFTQQVELDSQADYLLVITRMLVNRKTYTVKEFLETLQQLTEKNYELAINALHINVGKFDQVSTYASSPLIRKQATSNELLDE